MANKELLNYVENNEEQLNKTTVTGNQTRFLDSISKGLKMYGIYVSTYERTRKDETKVLSPVLETLDGLFILPDHIGINEPFKEIKVGDLVVVSCLDVKFNKKEEPTFYDWKVEIIHKEGLVLKK